LENFFFNLTSQQGPVVAAIASVLVIIGGVVLRTRGWISADKAPAPTTNGLADLNGKVSKIETRLTQVENDMRHLPTRDEFHKMDVALVRLETVVVGTSAAVSRIEGFLLDIKSRGSK
jgi:cytochrome oxidase assembly protein ShyY1